MVGPGAEDDDGFAPFVAVHEPRLRRALDGGEWTPAGPTIVDRVAAWDGRFLAIGTVSWLSSDTMPGD